ncbi:MAG: DUF805 domain-containing protein [Tannerella forsythia]|uniref:DUF805 domain-containing protein n=1 Tax=Tannerella forsythia TaxID=28112 RepID=A0A2A6E6G4_TANFO|nr:DUF805 domain-containing protein [Tannerella forsythia]OLQ19651.1 hypothetical protein BGK60_01055 [Tannerella forsythia]PDP43110.1 DUF805 domain-containing protein [Tannerella forsythia]
MKWFIKAFRQYADFSGRASRQEFWMFVLFNLLFAMAWAFVAGLLTGLFGGSFDQESRLIFMYKLIAIYYAVTAVPAMAVGVRRLHDTGRSGWWMLIGLVPLVGGIWLIVLMCSDDNPGDNRYGSPPDGTTGNVPKYDLRQKALMWLTAFAVFSIYMCLLNLVDVFSNRWYTGTDQLNMLLTLLGNFLVSVSFIIMGIAFLQKRDYSRTVGGWIIAAYVLLLILEIRWTTVITDFHINMRFVLNIMLFLAFILYGGLLLARKGRLPLANYVLMAASGCSVILTPVFLVPLRMMEAHSYLDYLISQLTLIVLLSLLVYAVANLAAAEKEIEHKEKTQE